MSVRLSCAVSGIALGLVLGICSPGLAVEKAANVNPEASAAELVRAALLSEASGKGPDRDQLLREALEKKSDYAPARWHSGYVRQGHEWLAVEQVAKRASLDERLAEYRKLRQQQTFEPAGELTLARWCRDHGLSSEARAHWMRVLTAQPQNPEALAALGVAWYEGQLLTRDQIEQARKSQSKTRHSRATVSKREKDWMDYWEPRVAKWRRLLESDEEKPGPSMREDLVAVKDPAAIHALGTLLVTRSQDAKNEKAYQTLSLGLVTLLDYSSEPWATGQLVRHAVDHPIAEVRTAAADALKNRPKEACVPLLLGRIRLPIEVSASAASLGLGGVIYQYSLEREGLDAVSVDTHVMHSHVKDTRGATSNDPGTVHKTGVGFTEQRLESARAAAKANALASLAVGRARAAQQSVKAHHQAAATLTAVRRSVDATNAETADLNRRVLYTLRQATGADVSADLVAWLKWWEEYCCEYYELEYPSADSEGSHKPVYEATWYGYTPMPFTTPSPVPVVVRGTIRPSSCFPWNTKVWTLTGRSNIDQMQPGDRVLAQHPRTGELAYKPVLQVTKRKPSPMIQIGTGKDTILTTRGHPFWVSGEGWKMAKQLEIGMRLHTVSGPATIDRLEQAPAAGPWYEQLKQRPDAKPEDVLSYNLVVDDFHNYFVGDQKILVHDNVLFPLDGPVPGVPGLASP